MPSGLTCIKPFSSPTGCQHIYGPWLINIKLAVLNTVVRHYFLGYTLQLKYIKSSKNNLNLWHSLKAFFETISLV